MADQDDVLYLIEDSGEAPEESNARKWKIAVIDDDHAVHEGTRFALSDYTLNGQSLEIVSAYSAAEGQTLMRENPAFIFFRELKGPGPVGAAGVALTPGRSLAVDGAFWPYGAPVWIDAGDDDGGAAPRLRRLLVAQDTGGAIRGPGRADLFWGNGPFAELAAGHMQHPGTLYFLVLKMDGA